MAIGQDQFSEYFRWETVYSSLIGFAFHCVFAFCFLIQMLDVPKYITFVVAISFNSFAIFINLLKTAKFSFSNQIHTRPTLSCLEKLPLGINILPNHEGENFGFSDNLIEVFFGDRAHVFGRMHKCNFALN